MPHAQDRGAQKRTQLAGRSASGYGLESPSPGGAQSQGHNTGLRGLAPRTGFPLNCRTHPLLGAKEYSPRVSSVYRAFAQQHLRSATDDASPAERPPRKDAQPLHATPGAGEYYFQKKYEPDPSQCSCRERRLVVHLPRETLRVTPHRKPCQQSSSGNVRKSHIH